MRSWLRSPSSALLVVAFDVHDLAHVVLVTEFGGIFQQDVVLFLDRLVGIFLQIVDGDLVVRPSQLGLSGLDDFFIVLRLDGSLLDDFLDRRRAGAAGLQKRFRVEGRAAARANRRVLAQVVVALRNWGRCVWFPIQVSPRLILRSLLNAYTHMEIQSKHARLPRHRVDVKI
jgi:hypothetical protein